VAFVFGSLASNREKAASDVDLMVIGSVALRTLSSWLSYLFPRLMAYFSLAGDISRVGSL
jgi:predicted nucleotidyltransferase